MSRPALRALAASGDAYAVGRTLGEASASALREVVPAIGRFQALMREWQGTDRLRSLESAARAVWPQYVREIEGIADGAGIAFDTVFLWNCRGDLPGGGGPTHWARAAGVEGRISGHSLRVGSAQSPAAAGAGVVEMQQAGRCGRLQTC